MKKLLIYSGGLDSTALLIRLWTEYSDVEAVSFDYGSKHNKKEIMAAKKYCERLDINHRTIDLNFIGKHFESDLLEKGGEIPEGHYESENMKKTVVPFRNGIMISIAAGLAESIGARDIYLASHFGDHAIYSDCRANFNTHMKKTLEEGTDSKIQLHTPYQSISKDQIIEDAYKKYDFSLSDSWSCYKGEEIHCGRCATCFERREAYYKAGIEDKTVYQDKTPIEELIKEYNV